MTSDTVNAVLVAAGSGSRLGSAVPKAFVQLGGKPLLLHSLTTLVSHPLISQIVIVVPDAMFHETERLAGALQSHKKLHVVKGGLERWESVRNGVCTSNAQWVLVHDAARPFVTIQVIDRLIDKSSEFQCVITATREVDTIRTFDGDRTLGTLDRSTLLRVGTPQLFRRDLLIDAFNAVSPVEPPPTDEAMLMEKRGIAVGFAWGDPRNFKITIPADLEIAEAILGSQQMLMGRQ